VGEKDTFIGRSDFFNKTSGSFPGVIDEVGVWNRVLQPNEIQQLAAGATPTSLATITASPNPCTLNAQGTCTAKITWTSQNAPDLQIKIKESPGSLFAAAPSGSQDATWITAPGATFEVWSGGKVIASLNVKGQTGGDSGGGGDSTTGQPCSVTEKGSNRTDSCPAGYTCQDLTPGVCTNSVPGSCSFTGVCQPGDRGGSGGSKEKSAKINANRTVCKPNDKGVCTIKISWTSQNAPDLQIYASDPNNKHILFSAGPQGQADAPWITEYGDTFEAYSGDQLLDTLVVTANRYALECSNTPQDSCPSGYSCNTHEGSSEGTCQLINIEPR
jgi:hypothetical protein